MAGPITWQNVGQTNFGDATGFMQLANQSATQAFDNAINRTKRSEEKTALKKTANILNQIGSVQDESTLNSLRSNIDLNDPDVDSNAIVKAFENQGSNLLSRKQALTGIAATEQNIAASKANQDLQQKEYLSNQARLAFDQQLATERNKREREEFKLNSTKAGLGIEALSLENKIKKDDVEFDSFRSKTFSDVMSGNTSIAEGSANIAKRAIELGRYDLAKNANKDFTQQVLSNAELRDDQKTDILNASKVFDGRIQQLTNIVDKKEKEFINTKYSGSIPKPPLTITQQIDTGVTNGMVLSEWAKNVNKDESFDTQGSLGSTLGGAGLPQLLSSVNDETSTLYTTFRKSLGDNTAKIDPALLKAGLSMTSSKDNTFTDGISETELAKTLKNLYLERKTYETFLDERKKAIGPTERELLDVIDKKRVDLQFIESKFKDDNIRSVAESFGNKNPENLLPSNNAFDRALESSGLTVGPLAGKSTPQIR